MRNCLLVASLALCVFAGNAQADYVKTSAYNPYTGSISDVDGNWEISGLFGTAYTNAKPYPAVDGAYWAVTEHPVFTGVDKLPPYDSKASFYGLAADLRGVFSIETTFNFELSGSADGVFELYFWNLSTLGDVSFVLNAGTSDEITLVSRFTSTANLGVIELDLADFVDGVNTFTMTLDTSRVEKIGSVNVGLVLAYPNPVVTPEPATLMVMGLGVLGSGFVARRKMKS